MDEMPQIDTVPSQAATGASGGMLRAAGRLVAIQAEQTKLLQITIPRLYAALGKTIYGNTALRKDFPDEVEAIETLRTELHNIEATAKDRPAGTSLVDKAKKAAMEATNLAQKQVIDVRIFQAMAALGTKAYAHLGTNAGAPEEISPLASALSRSADLHRQMSELETQSQGHWLRPRLSLAAIAGISALVFCGIVMRSGSNAVALPAKTQRKDSARSTGNSSNRSAVGNEHQDNTAPRNKEYLAMIANPKRRTCAEVFCALERYVNNGSVTPQSRTPDMTLRELKTQHGGTFMGDDANDAAPHIFSGGPVGRHAPLNAWEQVCGTNKAQPITAHGKAFNEDKLRYYAMQWPKCDLKEIRYECVDGDLFLMGVVDQDPLGATRFKPNMVLVIPNGQKAQEDKSRFSVTPPNKEKKQPSEYERGRLQGKQRAIATKQYVTQFPQTIDERAAAFWHEDLPKFQAGMQRSDYARGYVEGAIEQWKKEGLPMP